MLKFLFQEVLSSSVTGSYVILFVLIARFFLKNTPKIYSFALWWVVFFRLLCPFTIESPVSLVPDSVEFVSAITENPQQREQLWREWTKKEVFVLVDPQEEVAVVTPKKVSPSLFALIWWCGVVLFTAFTMISAVKLRRKLQISFHLKENIYLVDSIETPFVWGVLKPKIYLPSHISEEEMIYVLAHERAHLKRFDPIFRVISYIALVIHWFNPLVWLAFVLSGRDMELSADENALLSGEIIHEKQKYAAVLLRFAASEKLVSPLAFGEGDVKERIVNIMKLQKKTKFVAGLLTTFTCAFGLAMLLGSSEEKVPMEVLKSTEPLSLVTLREHPDLEFISIFTHLTEESVTGVDDFFENFQLVSTDFKKGDLAYEEFWDIFSGYTLDPMEYVVYEEDENTQNTIEARMIFDLEFLFRDQIETPVVDLTVALRGEDGSLLNELRIISNGTSILLDTTTTERLPYTLGDSGIELKEKVYNLMVKYPDSLEFVFSKES